MFYNSSHTEQIGIKTYEIFSLQMSDEFPCGFLFGGEKALLVMLRINEAHLCAAVLLGICRFTWEKKKKKWNNVSRMIK